MSAKKEKHVAVYLDEFEHARLSAFAKEHSTTLSTAARMLIVLALNQFPELIKSARQSISSEVNNSGARRLVRGMGKVKRGVSERRGENREGIEGSDAEIQAIGTNEETE